MDLRNGDCLEILKTIPDNSIDSVVCDPPYGLSNTNPSQVADALTAWISGDDTAVPAKRGGFMGKDWDSFVPPPAVWAECLRVLKPGGHMAVFAGARTQDLMGLSIRLAGFEIRDNLGWIYGSGFPKSHNISKAIDKASGVEFSARQWDGWGTALKPAIEPIILARKPLDGTVANNVLAHGVGGLNIDASRVETTETLGRAKAGWGSKAVGADDYGRFNSLGVTKEGGRWPANVLLDEHAAEAMDEQSGRSASKQTTGTRSGKESGILGGFAGQSETVMGHTDAGGASRFFPVFKYQAKAPKRERPVIEREDGTKIQHPTVKPLELMSWLVKLITPTGGTVLEPFAGSGTTLQAARDNGFDVIGIEQDPEYIELIRHRLESNPAPETPEEDPALF